MQNLLKNYTLSVALGLLFLFSWVGQGFAQWQEFSTEQKAHNQAVEVKDFVYAFGQATLENWQSEFLQLFSFVVLTGFLIHKRSPESKDSDEAMQRSLARIEKKLSELEEEFKSREPERASSGT